MLSGKGDYKYIAEEAMRHVKVPGNPFPERDATFVKTAENYLYATEAIAERSHLTGYEPKAIGKKDPLLIERGERIGDIYEMARSGRFYREDALEELEGDCTIYDLTGRNDYTEDYFEKLHEFAEDQDNALEELMRKREAHDKEREEKVKEWTDRSNEVAKEYRDKVEETRTDYDDRSQSIHDDKGRAEKRLESARDNRRRRALADYDKPERRMAIAVELQKADDEYAEGIEDVSYKAWKGLREAERNRDRELARAEEKRDRDLEKVDREIREYDSEWEKSFAQMSEDLVDEFRDRAIKLANMLGHPDMAEEYSSEKRDRDRRMENARLRISCFDNLINEINKRPAIPKDSTSLFEMAAADLDRMQLRGASSKPLMVAHAVTYTLNGKLEWKAGYGEGERNLIEDCSNGPGEQGSYDNGSTKFRIYYGTKQETEDGVVECITADAVYTREGFSQDEGEWTEYDEEHWNLIRDQLDFRDEDTWEEYKRTQPQGYYTTGDSYHNNTKIVHRVTFSRSGEVDNTVNDRYEKLIERREKGYEDAEKEYDENIDDIEREYKEKLEGIEKEREEMIAKALEDRDKAWKQANGDFIAALREVQPDTNGQIRDNRFDAKEVERILKEYGRKLEKLQKELAAKQTKAQEEYERKVNEINGQASERRSEEGKRRSEKVEAEYVRYQKERQTVADAFRDELTEMNEDLTDEINRVNEHYRKEESKITSKALDDQDKAYKDICATIRSYKGEEDEDVTYSVVLLGAEVFIEGRLWLPFDEETQSLYMSCILYGRNVDKIGNDARLAIEDLEWERIQALDKLPKLRYDDRMIFETPPLSPPDSAVVEGDMSGNTRVSVEFTNIVVHYRFRTTSSKDHTADWEESDRIAKHRGMIGDGTTDEE